MRLILVRHGHTNDLKRGIIQGHRPVPLNTLGRRQAKRTGRALRAQPIRHILSSDSRRAAETALIIARHHPRCTLEFDAQLREKGSGVYEGRLRRSLTPYVRRRLRATDYRPRRGESHVDLFQRAQDWYRWYRQAKPAGVTIVVSHGGFIRSLLTIVFHGRRFQFRPEYHHDNTGITVLTFRSRRRPRAEVMNDTGHLRGLPKAKYAE